MLKSLPDLEVKEDVIGTRDEYEKAHQLQYEESTFRAKMPLELIYSDVFGPVKQPSIRGSK